jgi:O-antigen/teichoic acid export membrane protein
MGIWRSWRHDRLLRNVIRSSGYLFSSNSVMVMLSMFQGILVARLVGMDGLGLVTTVTVFVSNIHRLMSFRMSEVIVKNLGEALEQQDTPKASATIRWAVFVETTTSLLAFGMLLLMAPWAAETLAKSPASTNLFWLYGLALIGNVLYETSTGILQTLRRFDRLASINVIQSGLTAVIILAAFLTHQGVVMVLIGYLAGKIFAGIAVFGSAFHILRNTLGRGWWSSKFSQPTYSRELFRFALNTNLQGTVNLLVRDNIPLLLAALRSQAEVGYFKLALSIINFVMLPIEPLIWPTYTEISRTIANRSWLLTRRLLRQVSLIAGAWTILAGGVIIAFGPWLIPFVYGSEAFPAYPVYLVLFLGYGFANILNWNRPLLLALNKPGYPLIVAVFVGFFEIGLTFLLVPRYGYLMQAAILSGYLIVSIGIITWRGLNELGKRALVEPSAGDLRD